MAELDTKRLLLQLKIKVGELLDSEQYNDLNEEGDLEPVKLSPRDLTEIGKLLISLAKFEAEIEKEEARKGTSKKVVGFPALPFEMNGGQ